MSEEGVIKLPRYECTRCGNAWHPRKEEVPLRCGRCKSPYWNRPKSEMKGRRR